MAVNEPQTLKVIAPAGLTSGTDYRIRVATLSSAKGGGALLKNIREIASEFVLSAQP